jgi:hypothetical protein
MYCICCKRDNVTPYDEMTNNSYSEEELLWGTEETTDGRIRTINNRSANDGIIHMIDAGYGSTHDGDQFIIAICDECIRENVKDGTLLYWGNYMGFPDLSEDDVQKSKMTYRRRKNIDKLV